MPATWRYAEDPAGLQSPSQEFDYRRIEQPNAIAPVGNVLCDAAIANAARPKINRGQGMKRTGLMSRRTAGLALAAAIFGAAAPTDSRAATVVVTQYAETVGCFSASTNQCTAQFPAVPANMRLIVQFIATSVTTPTPLVAVELETPSRAFIPILNTLQGNDLSGNKLYIANLPFIYYFRGSDAPTVFMTTQSGSVESINGQATITGYLIPATASIPQ